MPDDAPQVQPEGTVVDNIIIEESEQAVVVAAGEMANLVLFSSLRSDVKPVIPYDLSHMAGIEYPQLYSGKCAICNSPFRTLLEHVYIDSGKKVNSVLKFFEKHFNAKLNWAQVKQHIKFHCDFNRIETPGLKDYENREEELSRWKYREYDLALTAMLVEIDDVRGINARTPDEILRRATMIEKLTRQLIQIKQQRDDNAMALPNVFEVLYEVHEHMVDDEDKRIIREKVNELRKALS